MQPLTPAQVQTELQRGTIRLIDVREPGEVAIAAIEGAEVLPLSQAHSWIRDLPQDEALVFFCHHDGRSAQVAYYLAQHGYQQVTFMSGGIEAWAQTVDPSLARY